MSNSAINQAAQESSRVSAQYPFGLMGDDSTDAFHGVRVRVHPELKGDVAWDGEIDYLHKHGRLVELRKDGARIRVAGHRIEVLPGQKLPRLVKWRGSHYPEPTLDQLEEWTWDSVCETPDGETVEPDHPDSWLCLMGLI